MIVSEHEFDAAQEELSRSELIDLVRKILAVAGTEEQVHALVVLFEMNVPHPEASGLIFWPDDYGLGSDPTAEEIVDQALNYSPVLL